MPGLSVKFETSDFRNLPTARRGGTYTVNVFEPATGAEVAFRELDGEQAELLWRVVNNFNGELVIKDWIGESDAVR